MKKGAALALAVVFAACLIHFYFGEDHCPVHCPARGGGFGHVHPHHAGATGCQCFLASLSGPETCDLPATGELLTVLARPAAERLLGRPAAAITPPPRSLLV
jgi:hypothetical protein